MGSGAGLLVGHTTVCICQNSEKITLKKKKKTRKEVTQHTPKTITVSHVPALMLPDIKHKRA